MRKLLLLLLLALNGLAANAERRLMVQTSNGDVIFFTITQEMKVYFKDDYVQVYCDFWNKVNFILDDFDTISYTNDNEDAVNAMEADEWTVEEKDGQVILHGLKADTPVMLYNSAGILLSSSKAEKDKPLSLPVHALTSGTYIIKAKQQTLKFQKQ